MKTELTGGESPKIEQSTTPGHGEDVPTRNFLAEERDKNRSRRNSTSGESGKGSKRGSISTDSGKSSDIEAEEQTTHVVERGETQRDLPSDTNMQIETIREDIQRLSRKKEYGRLSRAEEQEMREMRLEEQDCVFEQYFTALEKGEPEDSPALNQNQLDSPAIQAAYNYVFQRIDASQAKMQIETGGEFKTPIDHIDALRSSYSHEYATRREDLRRAMTGKFYGSGFTASGDIEDNPRGFFMNNVKRKHVEDLVTRWLDAKLEE